MIRRLLLASALLTLLAGAESAWAARMQPAASIPAPSALCRAAILQAERMSHVPDRLLDAIAVVESGKRDPVSGAVYAWPWTINAEGIGHWYDSKMEAIAAVKELQARGVRSIDVGCMQVNLMHHADAFPNLETAFDPMANAAYASRFLQQLFNQTNAWPLAAAAYHSFTPDLGAEYAKKVLAAWGVPQLPVGSQAVTSSTSLSASAAQRPALGANPAAPNRVAVMLPTGNEAVRVLPMPGGQMGGGMGMGGMGGAGAMGGGGMGGAGAMGGGGMGGGGRANAMPAGTARGLDAYRAVPIAFAARMPRMF